MIKDELINLSSKKENAVLVIKMIDGHFDNETWWPRSCREPLFCHQQMLDVIGRALEKKKRLLSIHFKGDPKNHVWR